MAGVLRRMGNLDRETRVQGEGHVKTRTTVMHLLAKGRQRLPAHPLEPGKGRGFPYGLRGEHGPADSLISDFQPPGLWDDTFLLFSALRCVVLGHSSPNKIQGFPPSVLPAHGFPDVTILCWLNSKTSKHFPEHSRPSLEATRAHTPSLANPLLQLNLRAKPCDG